VTLLEENLAADMTTPTQPSQVVMGSISAADFTATLHYIESDSKTKILARPRVLTQNNEAAEIKLVTNQTIGVTTTAATSTAGASTTPERSDVGVIMRMTPQINDDGSVLLFVEPAISTSAISTFNAAFQDITTRSVRTMARIKDNETLVIGGLINTNDTSSQQKMPFLGDLPGIGRLFRYDAVNNDDRELVIFVTPHIVYGASSLGKHSATANGEDISLRNMLNAFMDKQMDQYAGEFQDYEKDKNSFFTTDQQFIRDTEKRLSNPLVEKQMTQALDALSPQLVDTQMTQALDTFNTKKYRSS
jgi:type II secretory pathway component GspD/PulD (secretin)